MDCDIENSFKLKYQKYKACVKAWETDFKNKYARIPSKYDIREAPQKIRDSYRMYYKLKTSFLETTLNDVLLDDGFDVLELSQNSCNDVSGLNEFSNNLPNDLPAIINDSVKIVDNVSQNIAESSKDSKNFESFDISKINEKAWLGNVLNKSNKQVTKKLKEKPTKTVNIKQLSTTPSFAKRNPRKPIRRDNESLIEVSQEMSSNNDLIETGNLMDLETILATKAKEQQSIEANSNIQTTVPEVTTTSKHIIKTNIDEEWLRRTAQQNDDKTLAADVVVSKPSDPAVTSRTFGLFKKEILENIKSMDTHKDDLKTENENIDKSFSKPAARVDSDSDAIIGDSDIEAENEKINHKAKRRRTMPNIVTETTRSANKKTAQKPKENMEINDEKIPNYIAETDKVSEKIKKIRNAKTKNKKTDVKKVTNSNKKTVKKLAIEKETEDLNSKQEMQPPDARDLKYELALESSNIIAKPRVKGSYLQKAKALTERYINTEIPTTTLKNQPECIINEKRAADRKKLEDKIASGKLNENYTALNLRKKVFVRGKKGMSYSKYKKGVWKNKKRIAALSGPDMDMRGCDGGVLKCFTCGEVGHFAQNCKMKGDNLLPLTAQIEEDPSPFPTLEEAKQMADAKNNGYTNITMEMNEETAKLNDDNDDDLENENENKNENCEEIKEYVGHEIPLDFLKAAGLLEDTTKQETFDVGAVYDLNNDGSVKEVTPEVIETLHMFGHTNFRKGQDRAIMRILSGLSTLVTLSTGSGKSLCYQLAAYLYTRHKRSITLVISPLVSLMEDQVHGVPHFLRALCLHTNQTQPQRQKVMEKLSNGEVDILFLSPEAVVAGERSTGFGSILRQLPPIAFACIDEAHCVSQWSHNFRPSYLMICKVLRKNLGVKTILGLTATATLPTRKSIIEHLGIIDGERGIISDIPLPDNLLLTISKDENKDSALISLLNSERFITLKSIIIYCTRRDECERISTLIRTCVQETDEAEEKSKKRKRTLWIAEPYHAGLAPSRRRVVQNAFMKNELRIVVATIAFGMGINKADIRAVIHYNMPKNFESYVQEVGRAGRDSKISYCHLFLNGDGDDQNELRRHVFGNSLDRHVIRKLLQRIFVPCSCDKNKRSNKNENQRACAGHEVGFPIDNTVQALDVPKENITTLLCYMELDTRWHLNVLSSAYMKAKIISYSGPKYLKHAAKDCPPLAMAIAMQIMDKTFDETSNIIELPVIEIAAKIGWNSGVVKYHLKNLEWTNVNGYPKRTPLNVQFNDLGFRIRVPGDFTEEEIDEALDTLYNRSSMQEQTQLIQLQYVFQGLSSVAYKSCLSIEDDVLNNKRSDQLKNIIRNYFQNDYPKDLELEATPTIAEDYIKNDIQALINMYPENNFSGRNIARIFHGISSPNYSALIWSRCKYWRAHTKVHFNSILILANMILFQQRI